LYTCFENPDQNQTLTVCGVPFAVTVSEGKVAKIASDRVQPPSGEGCYSKLYFLGMSTDHWQCSDWWAQTEVQYDASLRLFFGDRIGRIRIVFTDQTEELVSVIFGVNAFNYSLFFKAKPHEKLDNCFGAPYDEPFRSDPAARRLLEDALIMTENTADTAEKMTKWVFAYAPRADKQLDYIELVKEEGKRADFVVSAVTGLPTGQPDTDGLPAVDLGFFLRKGWSKPVEALRRRVYQYLDEIPAAVPLLEEPGFDAPDLRFYNAAGLDLFTNVYRKNIMDMAYRKVTDDGMPHTSSQGTANFGCYIGFGTFNKEDSYASHVWTRDIGRLLIELSCWGYYDRVAKAIDQLHQMLYYPSVRFHVPHWKRVANLVAEGENYLFNEGNENDGHASIMMAIYTYYRKSGAGVEWLQANQKYLKDAADYYLWQAENPRLSNFDGVLFSHSETSAQALGGYDLYANIISVTAMRMYARLFDALGQGVYADRLRALAESIHAAAKQKFTMQDYRSGAVWTDTNDDCWTYEYKRFVEILMASDVQTLDASLDDPEKFELLTRTFAAEKDLYYDPYSGRQMGYGQGYLTGAALMLDLVPEYTDCVNASANLCYHHTDLPYIVPEGVIRHGSGRYWYRNSDLGNAVQQAEIVKEARLMVGADDLAGNGFQLVPRLPATMTGLSAQNVPVTVQGKTYRIGYTYTRGGQGTVQVTDGSTVYAIDYTGDIKPRWMRVGPFGWDTITANVPVQQIRAIQGRYYAYVTL